MAGIRIAMLCAVIQAISAGSALAQATATAPPAQATAGAIVFVTPTDDGPELKGRMVSFGPETLTLLSKGQRTTLPMSRVQRIDLHDDSLKNGAIIGAAVYGGLTLIALGGDPELRSDPMFIPVILMQTGVGALLGTAIDALHRGRTPLYRRTTSSLSVAPARKGVAVGMSFRF
ncbi:MAG TPA: hypothetical protein VFV98_10165 [Vicinamibacterales bacterium]|nr:hypothetical protein [Vicinamibacterales bacterium]